MTSELSLPLPTFLWNDIDPVSWSVSILMEPYLLKWFQRARCWSQSSCLLAAWHNTSEATLGSHSCDCSASGPLVSVRLQVWVRVTDVRKSYRNPLSVALQLASLGPISPSKREFWISLQWMQDQGHCLFMESFLKQGGGIEVWERSHTHTSMLAPKTLWTWFFWTLCYYLQPCKAGKMLPNQRIVLYNAFFAQVWMTYKEKEVRTQAWFLFHAVTFRLQD